MSKLSKKDIEELRDILSLGCDYADTKTVVYETVDKASTLVLIEGQKNGKVGLIIEKPLILYNEDGSYTSEYACLQKEVRV